VALSVAGRFALVPTTAPPKAQLAGVTNCPAAVPVPDSGMFKVGFDAFEETAIFPLALPADGVRMTQKVVRLDGCWLHFLFQFWASSSK
jgi:hypothetical protein